MAVLFESFELSPHLLDSIATMGFVDATPIQGAAIPHILRGRDVIGGARTGSGKTAAYGLPLLQTIDPTSTAVQALVLAPTRELVIQVELALRSYAGALPIRMFPIYGGAPYDPQLRALSRGVQVVVGTPGRVIDHIERGTLDLGELKMLVLDEADEMLRMGFIEDVERVLAASPDGRQIVLFSATMPLAIRRVAGRYLDNPAEVQVENERLTVEHIEQRWMLVPDPHKIDALRRVLETEPSGATLVFARTRKSCADIADALAKRGIAADALHGDLNQAARERIIGRLRDKSVDVLIATDVAARGIDIEHIERVVNLDLPIDTETYVHRIGRTGRAGRKGVAISFITPGERRSLSFLERKLDAPITHVPVPSDAQIASAHRSRLKASLIAAGATDAAEVTRRWLAELVAEGEQSVEDLAIAAITELAASRRINLRSGADELPPSWARHAAGPARPFGARGERRGGGEGRAGERGLAREGR
ncbi:MAG: DEAD/DEAH box helicase, partial [Myxococcales bacterium]|nr:DEAD/DEAH box helicase [Myxococcales bacterium]